LSVIGRPRLPSASSSRPADRHDLAGRPGQLVDEGQLAELQHQRPEVAGVEELHPQVRVQLEDAPELAVLLADELLAERRHLEVQVEVGSQKSGEKLSTTLPSRFQTIGNVWRLVLPADLVEVEDPGHLGLARVGERGVGAALEGSGDAAIDGSERRVEWARRRSAGVGASRCGRRARGPCGGRAAARDRRREAPERRVVVTRGSARGVAATDERVEVARSSSRRTASTSSTPIGSAARNRASSAGRNSP
jgi:hypothetical protein